MRCGYISDVWYNMRCEDQQTTWQFIKAVVGFSALLFSTSQVKTFAFCISECRVDFGSNSGLTLHLQKEAKEKAALLISSQIKMANKRMLYVGKKTQRSFLECVLVAFMKLSE